MSKFVVAWVAAVGMGACGSSPGAVDAGADTSTPFDGAVDAAVDAGVDAPTAPVEEARLVGSATGNDVFGSSVSLSDDASRALIGAVGDNSARVFVRTGTTWVQEASLVALVPGPNDFFGQSVALSSDGGRALVGAPSDNTPAGTSAGSARVFLRTGTTWTEEAILRAVVGEPYDYLGGSVALTADGTRALVGSAYDNVTAGNTEGSARVFRRSGTTWVEETVLAAADGAQFDRFGEAVALSADGTRAIVGAPLDDTATVGGAGSAHVFVRSGTTWVVETTLVDVGGMMGANFGASVALSADGGRAIVGSRYGKTRVFLRTGTTWAEEAAFVSSDELFGAAVALTSDASRAMVGAPLAQTDGAARGVVHVFERSGTTWTEKAPLFGAGVTPLAYYGISVALTANGSRGIVGAYGDNTTGTARVVYFP